MRRPRLQPPRWVRLSIGALVSLVLLGPTTADAIVGGAPAPAGRWPWMAALLDSSVANAGWAQFCGASVIAPRRVLTTAHCVEGRETGELDVLVGRSRLTDSGGRRIAVKAISLYPGYVNK